MEDRDVSFLTLHCWLSVMIDHSKNRKSHFIVNKMIWKRFFYQTSKFLSGLYLNIKRQKKSFLLLSKHGSTATPVIADVWAMWPCWITPGTEVTHAIKMARLLGRGKRKDMMLWKQSCYTKCTVKVWVLSLVKPLQICTPILCISQLITVPVIQ